MTTCPRIAHETGVVLRCQVDHSRHPDAPHATRAGVVWGDEDDRIVTDTNQPATPTVDLSRFRDAVHLRDQCRKAAMEHHQRCGLIPSPLYANATYDAIAELIRADERRTRHGATDA